MPKVYTECIGVDFTNHFQTYTDSQVLLGMLARVQVAYTRPYCSPPMQPWHEANMKKDTRLSPLFVLQATKAGWGLGTRLAHFFVLIIYLH